jgi:hypothetical protein
VTTIRTSSNRHMIRGPRTAEGRPENIVAIANGTIG